MVAADSVQNLRDAPRAQAARPGRVPAGLTVARDSPRLRFGEGGLRASVV